MLVQVAAGRLMIQVRLVIAPFEVHEQARVVFLETLQYLLTFDRVLLDAILVHGHLL